MKIAGFRFFNQSGEQVGPQVLHPLPTAWLPLTAAAAAAGEYTCMYFVEDAGREVPSGRSVPLAVEVRAAPAAPTFSLDPQQRIYRTGGSVTLRCSVPASPDYVREVQYYGDSGLAVSIPVWNVRNCSYELRLAGRELSGSYSCAYFVYKSARPVRSGRSRWIRVTVKRHQIGWIRDAAVGGSFFTINGLIFVFTHLRMKRQERQD
ncbi:hypothetical protein Q9966_016193 [Columba livia]|nr:hypothetical protein Q9966_016193 [Columba livia]